MSILVVEVVPEGILFGADRNITETRHRGSSPTVEIHGQNQRPKVIRWPRNLALLGYVGAGELGGQPTDDWLYDFIGDHPRFSSLDALAEDLRAKVEAQRLIDDEGQEPEALIIHLGGFEERGGTQVPVVWYVRNAFDLGPEGYQTTRSTFEASDEFRRHFQDVAPVDIREALAEKARNYEPFWFHQGLDLHTFNTLKAYVGAAFRLLCETHPDHSIPTELDDWKQQVRMSVLIYGAYFEAYGGVSERYVGGGADVVPIPWPRES